MLKCTIKSNLTNEKNMASEPSAAHPQELRLRKEGIKKGRKRSKVILKELEKLLRGN